jgi:hypothetical protein
MIKVDIKIKDDKYLRIEGVCVKRCTSQSREYPICLEAIFACVKIMCSNVLLVMTHELLLFTSLVLVAAYSVRFLKIMRQQLVRQARCVYLHSSKENVAALF